MSVLQGFNAGFNALDRHYQQEESERRYNQQYDRQLDSDKMREESHAQGMKSGALGLQIQQNQVDRMPIQNARQDAQVGLQYNNSLQQQEINQNTIDRLPINNQRQDQQYENQQALTDIQTTNATQQGEVQDYNFTRQKASDKNSDLLSQITAVLSYTNQTNDPAQLANFIASNDLKGTNLELLQDPNNWEALAKVSDGLQSGNFKQAIEGFNVGFKSKLNKAVGTKGKNGGTIRDVSAIEIIADENNPEQLRMRVQVITDKGSYPSFISELRSSEDGDKVKMFDLNELIGTGATMGKLSKMLSSSGYAEQFAQRSNSYVQALSPKEKGKWKLVEGINGPTGKFNEETGERIPFTQEEQSNYLSNSPESSLTDDQNEQRQRLNDDKDRQAVEGLMKNLTSKELGLQPAQLDRIAQNTMTTVKGFINSGKKPNTDEILESEIEKYKNTLASYEVDRTQGAQQFVDTRDNGLQGLVNRGGF